MSFPRYGVIRAHPKLPEEFLPPGMDGLWMPVEKIPDFMGDVPVLATGRFEPRQGDDMLAEIYEVGG